MSDIVSRLLDVSPHMGGPPSEQHYIDCIQAAKEIISLRLAIRRLADQDATLSVCDGNVTVTMDGTLTDEEREAIRLCADMNPRLWDGKTSATLRSLLERTQ